MKVLGGTRGEPKNAREIPEGNAKVALCDKNVCAVGHCFLRAVIGGTQVLIRS